MIVFVLNGSGIDQADAVTANELRGLGYALAGIGDALSQEATTVACREGFAKEARALAENVGTGAEVVPFPDDRPLEADRRGPTASSPWGRRPDLHARSRAVHVGEAVALRKLRDRDRLP